MLAEEPYGMVMKRVWYCYTCIKSVTEECEEVEDDEEEESRSKLPPPFWWKKLSQKQGKFKISCKGCGFYSGLDDFKMKLFIVPNVPIVKITCLRCGAAEAYPIVG